MASRATNEPLTIEEQQALQEAVNKIKLECLGVENSIKEGKIAPILVQVLILAAELEVLVVSTHFVRFKYKAE